MILTAQNSQPSKVKKSATQSKNTAAKQVSATSTANVESETSNQAPCKSGRVTRPSRAKQEQLFEIQMKQDAKDAKARAKKSKKASASASQDMTAQLNSQQQ